MLFAVPLHSQSDEQDARRLTNLHLFLRQQMESYRDHLLREGKVVNDLPQLTQYIESVLARLVNDSLAKTLPLRVRLISTPGTSILTFPDGTLFIPLSVLLVLRTEAELAYLLAHEVIHYSHGDYFRGIPLPNPDMERLNYDRSPDFFECRHGNNKYDRETDSLALELLIRSGYSIHGIPTSFLHLSLMDHQQEPGGNEGSRITFPKIGDGEKGNDPFHEFILQKGSFAPRYKWLSALCKETPLNGKNFLTDSLLFCSLHQELIPKYHTLLWLQDENIYSARMAFRNYLLSDQDSTHLYYLCESIRRDLFLFPGHSKKGFATEPYKFFFRTKGILSDIRFLVSDEQISHSKKELVDTTFLEFNTYEDAMAWFLQKAEGLKNPELELTKALYYWKDFPKRNAALEKYLGSPVIRYREYAETLFKGNILRSILDNSKNGVVLMPMKFFQKGFSSGLQKTINDSTNFKWKKLMEERIGRHIASPNYIEPDGLMPQHAFTLFSMPVYESIPTEEHCLGYQLMNLEIDSSYIRKRNPFLYDPEVWIWMEQENLKNITFIDPYHWSQNHHLGSDAIGIQSLSFDPRKYRVIQSSTDVVWKRIRPAYLENSIYYNLKELSIGEDKNHGFIGRKNRFAFDLVPVLHNGIYKIEYGHSILKNLMVNIGYGYISKNGEFDHSYKDSNQVSLTEHLRYENAGTIWSISATWNFDGSGLPAPMGWYAESGIEYIRNSFSERDDTSSTSFNYENKSLAFLVNTGTMIWMGKGLCVDVGIKSGLLIGNVIPLNSASAYRVPVRQYPDAYVWNPDNPFNYTFVSDDVNGTGGSAFATFRLYYTKLLFYPSLKLSWLF